MWLFDRIRSVAKNIATAVKGVFTWFRNDASSAQEAAREIERLKMVNIYRDRLAQKRQQRAVIPPTVEPLPVCHPPVLQPYANRTTRPAWAQTAYNLYVRGEIRSIPELKETLETLRFMYERPQLRK